MIKKIKHILREYKKVSEICYAFGDKPMKFRKYFFMKYKELKNVEL